MNDTRPQPDVDAIILSGGLSSRMGQDKATLQTPDGHSLLQHCQQLSVDLGAKQILVSSNTEADGIRDNYKLAGPLAGIEAALPLVQAERVLILPIDMPLMTNAVLQNLLHYAVVHRRSCCYRGQCLPLVVADPKQAHHQVVKLLSSKSKASVWRFCQAIGCSELEHSFDNCFDNANTPSQWQECLQKMHQVDSAAP